MRKSIWGFLVIELVFLAVVFTVGLVFLAPNIGVVGGTFTAIPAYLGEVLAKTIFAVVFTLVQSFVFFRFCFDIHFYGLRIRFYESRNDSHAFLLAGIAGSVVAALVMSHGVNIHQYLYNICTKVPIGYFIAVIITAIVARIFGVRSAEEFRHWIDQNDNDSYAVLVSTILILSTIIAMST